MHAQDTEDIMVSHCQCPRRTKFHKFGRASPPKSIVLLFRSTRGIEAVSTENAE